MNKNFREGREAMIYRRKTYKVDAKIVKEFNQHFNETLLPAQLKHGARLIGRWMTAETADITEIFAISEYDSYETYEEIESCVKTDQAHVERVQAWLNKIGKENTGAYLKDEVKEDFLETTLSTNRNHLT